MRHCANFKGPLGRNVYPTQCKYVLNFLHIYVYSVLMGDLLSDKILLLPSYFKVFFYVTQS